MMRITQHINLLDQVIVSTAIVKHLSLPTERALENLAYF
jgi:hypothetical protein